MIQIQKGNADFCSVFRCELAAIDLGLDIISLLPPAKKILILTDSKSAVEYLANWHNVRDFTGVKILKNLKNLSRCHQIHLQWIPSYVGTSSNETADRYVKANTSEATVSPVSLTFLELFPIAKFKNKSDWLTPARPASNLLPARRNSHRMFSQRSLSSL